MSFYSSVKWVFPITPPPMTAGQLKALCDELLTVLDLAGNGAHCTKVKLRYGKAIDQDREPQSAIKWENSRRGGMLGRFLPETWGHVSESNVPWPEQWPSAEEAAHKIYRAHVNFGPLTKPTIQELKTIEAGVPDEDARYGVPDSLSLSVDPILPGTLADEQRAIVGFIGLSFHGNGYFTWQPLAQYAEQLLRSESVLRAHAVLRQHFPGQLNAAQVDLLRELLGELFLNRASYQTGDWLLTVSETG